jgi:hypothetical protein
MYPVSLPIESLNTNAVNKAVAELTKNRPPNVDKTTFAEMDNDLTSLQERAQHHQMLIEREEEELKHFQAVLARHVESIRLTKELVGKRPALRNDLAEKERELEYRQRDVDDSEKHLDRHRNMLAGVQKLLREFDHAKYNALKAEEVALRKAGI